MLEMKLKSIIYGKSILLLQGPVGPFFFLVAQWLKKRGIVTHKINFNGGDWLFFPRHSTLFRKGIDEWSSFLRTFLLTKKIDQIILFGDCRPIHHYAKTVAKELGIEIVVFEEGYLRPDYITVEIHGVNGHSHISKNQQFYLTQTIRPTVKKIPVGNTFYYAALWTSLYYLAAQLLWPFFRRYQHHRQLNLTQSLYWVRSLYRKVIYKIKEQKIQPMLIKNWHKKFFLVPLQVYNDSQIHNHSHYQDITQFITEIMGSFAQHAPKDTCLVIKHHPLDRGYRDYNKHIVRVAKEWQIADRVHYIHDQHLPSLLSAALGVVVINSTVGLSALHHHAPVKVMGRAIYDIVGLTYQQSLATFWLHAQDFQINMPTYNHFINYLIVNNQVNGNFYKVSTLFDVHAELSHNHSNK